ncbi:MAG: M48 family metallopeptidase [Parvularculaceae bacterium]|nr:M48 family metallopeptidase [Parvularculaceae bacterium]
MGAYGLQTHIWNNNLKSALLLAGFPVLLILLAYGLILLYVGASADVANVGQGLALAASDLARVWPFALLAAGLWFAIAWALYQPIINASVGAKPLDRRENPELYNLLENLCISRGLAMPKLAVIETPAMNAFASGLGEKSAQVTVTRGLVEALDKEEVEAVLAHELTHIRNRDVRLLVIAVIFVGIFSFIGEMIYRGFFRSGVRIGGHSDSRNGDSRGGGLLILIALALIGVAYALAIVVRFALSQKREFLADAGAADLTRNPDSMISALKKISGRSGFDAPNDVQQMMLDSDARFAGVFATHPSIEKRIDALRRYAGGAA